MLGGLLITAISCSNAESEDVTLPFYSDMDFTPKWLGEDFSSIKNVPEIAPFSFVDQNGKTVTEQNFAGKIYIADFFFTACPGICPKMTKNMAKIQDLFLNDEGVLLISHSVTPEADSVAVLKRYARNNGVIDGKWHLVTGEKKAIYELARNSYFADEDFGLQDIESVFLHTENFYLVDQNRRIRGVYKGTFQTEVERLREDVEILRKERL